MGKSISSAVLDAALDYIADNGIKIHLCVGQPADFAGASTLVSSGGNSVLNYTMVAGVGNGDYTITDGPGSDGRKLQVGSGVTSVNAIEGGQVDHLAITDNLAELIFVTDVPVKTVVAGNPVDIGAWFIEMTDPIAT